jgi:hypothetical protein
MSESTADGPPPFRDPDAQHAIAGAWRPMLRDVVRCFVAGDYGLVRGVPGVEPVSAATVEQIRNYVSDYGATLVELPDDTWETSVAQWMEGHWDILVDLWTAEEGRSDMVLDCEVVETATGPRITIHTVYVP